MESKDKMHSGPQEEVENSEETTEFVQESELVNTADTEEASGEGLSQPEAVVELLDNPDSEEKVTAETPTEEVFEEKVTVEVPAEDVLEEKVASEVLVETPAEEVVEEKVDAETPVEEANKEVEVVNETVTTETEAVNSGVQKEELAEKTEEAASDEKVDEQKVEKVKEEAKQGVDYSKMTEIELINEFRTLMENEDFMEIYHKVDTIKVNFYKKLKAKQQEQKKKFVEDGGLEEEYKSTPDMYEQDLKALIAQYRQKKIQYNKVIEAEKDANLKAKYQIIEEIKGLINRKESINKTFLEFKDLQQKWRDAGLVPQASMKGLWETYHHHVENFYDYIKINKELLDLDLKKNLEEKISLCESAEALLLEPSVIKAFNTLQKLHDAWREIGPVPRDKKEELWERFKDATTQINKKHQEFFENRKQSQKKNLDAKSALCDKVDDILALDISSHKEWEEKSGEIIELQKYWRTIGFAPKKENNSIYERFRTECDHFFDKKREFYAKHKEIQSNNLQLKIDLCVQAEAIKDNTDWKKTTDEYIAIQKKWKEVGPVPRKHSDLVWKRFRAACDYFFEKKSEFFSTKDETQIENLKLKNDLIVEVDAFVSTGDDKDDFEKLRNFQSRWTDIGHVPIGDKDSVMKKFRDSINAQFDKLRVDDKDRSLLKFKNKISDWNTFSRGQNKLLAERDKYVVKLKHLESDLITLKNNIGFFANSKNAEALVNDVKRKIQNNEDQIQYLKEKIRVIDEVDSNE